MLSTRVPMQHQGNENLFMAVEMSLVSTLAGTPLHIHAEGLRGTGKTTVMRWARQAMPAITRICGCRYYCDPTAPRCPEHRDSAPGNGWAAEELPMPFIEVGHGAKLGTVLGSIDLGRLTNRSRPEAAILPGAIPMANRGVIFIDEVNRLAETAPEITDVLLSVMGTKPGLVKIEEVGLPPAEIEVLASVWAASNPDEDPGPLEEIRKQLADRFDLVVPVQRPSDPAFVERLLLGESCGPEGARPFVGLAAKAFRLKDVTVPPHLVRYMSQLYVHRNVESLRAVEALELACRLHAALHERDEVSFDEVLAVIPLVLRHRVEPAALSEILKDLELRRAAGAQVKSPPPPSEPTPDTPGEQASASPDGPAKDYESPQTSADDAAPPSDHSKRSQKATWFEKLVDRYRKASSGTRTGGGRRGSAGAQRLPDPATMKPVSPPDRARRITSISWPDLVTPPDWKDHLP